MQQFSIHTSLSAFISIKTGFCFSIFYFFLKGEVFHFECGCTNSMPPYKIPEWQCLNEIVAIYFQSLLETLTRPHTLMFIHVTAAVYNTKHLIALSWRRSSFEGRLLFLHPGNLWKQVVDIIFIFPSERRRKGPFVSCLVTARRTEKGLKGSSCPIILDR